MPSTGRPIWSEAKKRFDYIGIDRAFEHGAGLVVVGGPVTGHHHRAEVAQVELVEIRDRGGGPVLPLGVAQPGVQALGHGHDLIDGVAGGTPTAAC